FIFAAFMTPGQDPVSMMVLALSLTVLMEVAIQFTRINDRRRDKQRPDWLDLDDERSSGPSAASGRTGQLGGIDASARVSASGALGGTAPVGRTAPVSGPGGVGAPSPAGTSPRPTTRPTRNSRPAPPAAPPAEVTPDLSTRSGSDFDDVL